MKKQLFTLMLFCAAASTHEMHSASWIRQKWFMFRSAWNNGLVRLGLTRSTDELKAKEFVAKIDKIAMDATLFFGSIVRNLSGKPPLDIDSQSSPANNDNPDKASGQLNGLLFVNAFARALSGEPALDEKGEPVQMENQVDIVKETLEPYGIYEEGISRDEKMARFQKAEKLLNLIISKLTTTPIANNEKMEPFELDLFNKFRKLAIARIELLMKTSGIEEEAE